MFKVPEEYRIKDHPTLGSDEAFGNNGAFLIPIDNQYTAYVIASDGHGWEHVSLNLKNGVKFKTPDWSEMCKIKAMFWNEEDTVIQYHPAKSDYVNCHPNVLHLWRPINQEIPKPPSILVGPK